MEKSRSFASSMKLFLVSFLLILTLIACTNNQTPPTPLPQSVEVLDIEITSDTPIPSLEPYIFASSDPGYATLEGRLIVLDPQSILPASDDAIFLVELDPDEPISTIPVFKDGDDIPQADVDERTGEFVFVNVPPGRYAVVVVTMGGSQFPTRKFDNGSYAIFNISETDQDVNLGELTLP